MNVSPGKLDARITEGVGNYTPLLGNSGVEIPLSTVRPDITWIPPQDSPVVKGLTEVFDVHGFEVPRAPHVVGSFALTSIPEGLNVNSMPIKFPGTGYRLSEELEGVQELAEHIVAIEQEINPDIDGFYAYASVYNTYVEQGKRQLAGRIHSDEVQGQRVQPKVTSGHVYLVTDRDPTVFYPNQTFDMTGIDPDVHLLDDIFAQADPANAHQYEPGDVVLADAYCVHDGVDATSSGYRSLAKITYSVRQFDRLGNTRNALFEDEYQQHGWNFQPRPMPTNLVSPL